MRALQGEPQLEVAERRDRAHSFRQGGDQEGWKGADTHHQELSARGRSRIRHGGGRTRLHCQANTWRFIHQPSFLLFNLIANLSVGGLIFTGTNSTSFSEREAEILKPLASVEVVEKEDAMFETEISEEDVAGEWKLKGEVLTRSPVGLHGLVCFEMSVFLLLRMCVCVHVNAVMSSPDVRHPNGGWCA